MQNPTDALTFIIRHHDEHEQLFEAVESAEGAERKALLAELTRAMYAHVQMEEQLFYPAVFTKDLEDKLREANEEHLALKRIFADLAGMAVDDEQFAPKLKVAKEQAEHHERKEEEGELFPDVRKAMSRAQLDALGVELGLLYETLLVASTPQALARDTEQAAPL